MRNPLRALFEQKSGIGSSHELLNYLLRGSTSVAGATVNESTALNIAAVYTGVAIRSRLLSTLPVDVIEKVDERNSVQRPFHSIAKVLSQPNKDSLRQTKSEFVGMLETHRLLRGNGYAWINRAINPRITDAERLMVTELIPMHPDRVEVLDQPDDFGGTSYRLHKRNGTTLDLSSLEVLHVKGLMTNGRTGRSFIHDMRELIGSAIATQEHAASLWSRDATPSVVLKHPKTLSEKAKSGLETAWEQVYGRGKEKRRVAVIEEGMEIQQLSLTPEDGQFLQTQQDLRSQIAAALMVPPHLMGLSEKATSWGTGIAQQNIGLLTITMGPDIRTWEERLAMDLLFSDRFQIKFNVRAFLRGDLASQIETLVKGIQGSIYSVNDARAWLDLNPIADGDSYLQPMNFAPLGFVPAPKGTGASE